MKYKQKLHLGTKIKLINMPFASPFQPSLALGTLKAILEETGLSVEVFEFSLDMAVEIGLDVCEKFGISNVQFAEWVFAPHAFPGKANSIGPEEFIGLYGLPVPKDPKWPENSKFLVRFRETLAPAFLKSCARVILSEDPPAIVGFSCSYFQTMASVALARILKETRPDTVTLFGGSDFHGGPGLEKIRNIPWIDAVALGESDGEIHRICQFLLNHGGFSNPGPDECEIDPSEMIEPEKVGTDSQEMPADSEGVIPGFACRVRSGNNDIYHSPPTMASEKKLRSTPIPDYGDFFTRAEVLGLRKNPDWTAKLTIPFEGSRGCWWGERNHCRFCGLNGEGMQFRRKTGKQVHEMLTALAGRHGVPTFSASDNNLPMDAFNDLIPLLISAPPANGVKIFYSLKSNLERNHLKSLAKAGITDIGPGIESLSTKLLGLMKKGVRGIDNIYFLKGCREFSIRPRWNNLVRIPGETEQAYAELARLFNLVQHLHPPFATVEIQLYRYSPYFDEPGWVTARRSARFYDALYPPELFDNERVAYAFEAVWNGVLPALSRQGATETCERWRDRWAAGSGNAPKLEVIDERKIIDTRPGRKGLKEYLKILEVHKDGSGLPELEFEQIDEGLLWHLSPMAAAVLCAFTEPGTFDRFDEESIPLEDKRLLPDCMSSLLTAGLLIGENGTYLSLPIDGCNLLEANRVPHQKVETSQSLEL